MIHFGELLNWVHAETDFPDTQTLVRTLEALDSRRNRTAQNPSRHGSIMWLVQCSVSTRAARRTCLGREPLPRVPDIALSKTVLALPGGQTQPLRTRARPRPSNGDVVRQCASAERSHATPSVNSLFVFARVKQPAPKRLVSRFDIAIEIAISLLHTCLPRRHHDGLVSPTGHVTCNASINRGAEANNKLTPSRVVGPSQQPLVVVSGRPGVEGGGGSG